jgi:hypothetical protein
VRAAAALVLLLLLGVGCSDAPSRERPAAGRTEAPAVGGAVPVRHVPPRTAMNRLERPVAERLAAQIADQGLTLEYLDCPRWDSTVPSRMTCRAYVDGVVASVLVHLKAVAGRSVSFDARLGDGVIATRNLENTLHDQGWSVADCGDVMAYPARAGDTIVCRVQRPGDRRYVVATITDRSGAVTITGYRSGSASR